MSDIKVGPTYTFPIGGGSAFPTLGEDLAAGGSAGMSLRDYFAAHAPMSDQAWRGLIDVAKDELSKSGELWPNVMAKNLAEWSYSYADAMIAERNKS